MRVFISWSGKDSHTLARILREWLPTVVPFVEPWLSSEDIGKGQRWAAEIGDHLKKASCCIVCVTPAVANKPWVNFEAGAISKIVEDSRVSPLLLGVRPEELAGLPLSIFQCTSFTKADLRRLLLSINDRCDSPMPTSEVTNKLDQTWNWLKSRVEEIHLCDVDNLDSSGNEDDDANYAVLDTEREDVLAIFAQLDGNHLEAEDVAPRIEAKLVRTKHFLGWLEKRGYLHEYWVVDEPPSYSLTDKGRAYVVDHDLDR